MVDVQTQLLPLVIFLAMAALGAELVWHEFRAVGQRSRTLILGTVIHTLTFPVLALAAVLGALVFELDVSESLLGGMLLIAACPSGGFSNVLVLAARANLALSIVLTVVSSLLSFFTVPGLIELFGKVLPTVSSSVELPVGQTLLQLFLLVVLPVAVGMLCRRVWPDYVQPRVESMQKRTQILLYAVVFAMVAQQADLFAAAMAEALPWSIALCFAVLIAGYGIARLLRISRADAVTIAIEGGVRNVAVALLVAAVVLERVDLAVLPTIYFGAVLIVGFIFARVSRRFIAVGED